MRLLNIAKLFHRKASKTESASEDNNQQLNSSQAGSAESKNTLDQIESARTRKARTFFGNNAKRSNRPSPPIASNRPADENDVQNNNSTSTENATAKNNVDIRAEHSWGSKSKTAEEQIFDTFRLHPANIEDKQIDAWRQKVEGNCTSVGIIKAGMEKFGPDLIEITKLDDGVNIRMKDDPERVYHLSKAEIELAKKSSGLAGDDKHALAYANTCFAAMAKRAETDGYEGVKSFQGALNELNSGAFIGPAAELLGLQNNIQKIDPNTVDENAVASSSLHTVFLDKIAGRVYADHYGSPATYDATDTNAPWHRRPNRRAALRQPHNFFEAYKIVD